MPRSAIKISSQLEFSLTLLYPEELMLYYNILHFTTLQSSITCLFLYVQIPRFHKNIDTLVMKKVNTYKDNMDDTLVCFACHTVIRVLVLEELKRSINVLSIVSFQHVRLVGLFLLVTVTISEQLKQHGTTLW